MSQTALIVDILDGNGELEHQNDNLNKENVAFPCTLDWWDSLTGFANKNARSYSS